jgi:hypothetical protein
MVLRLSLRLLALQPAVDPLDAADNARQARIGALMAEDRWAEAADEAEAALASGRTSSPDLAILAGNLRRRAGHHAHAWRHFNDLGQTPDLPPDTRTIAAIRLDQLAPSTRLVDVQLSPAVARATLVARRHDARPPPDLAVPLVDNRATLRLDTGTWELLVTAPNHAPLRHIVGPDVAGPLALTLEPVAPPAPPPQKSPPPPPPAKPRVPPALIAGGVLVPLGLAALAGTFAALPAHNRIADRFDALRDDLTTRPCTPADVAELRSLTAASRQQEHLMLGLGATAGALLTAGAVLLVRGARERRQLHLDTSRGALILGLSGHF